MKYLKKRIELLEQNVSFYEIEFKIKYKDDMQNDLIGQTIHKEIMKGQNPTNQEIERFLRFNYPLVKSNKISLVSVNEIKPLIISLDENIKNETDESFYEISTEVVTNLSELERETLFNALIFARDMNGIEYDGDFDHEILDDLIDRLFNLND